MNKIGNCPECGKLYVDNGVGMCRDCYVKEEENETIVASFVRDHPKTSVEEIHEATGIKEKTIFRMIRNGRFVSDMEISYPCDSCGAPIIKGRLCDKCSTNIMKQVYENEKKREAVKKPFDKKDSSRGMYTNKM
ncbi:MAG: flagellar protein [Selenomonadaceae bacterium]